METKTYGKLSLMKSGIKVCLCESDSIYPLVAYSIEFSGTDPTKHKVPVISMEFC